MIRPIRDRRLFEELRTSGRRVRRGPLTVTYLPLASNEGLLVAFAIGRRFGGAVVRNRARRRLREAFRQAVRTEGPVPAALLVQARPEVLDRPFPALLDDAAGVVRTVSKAAATW